MTDRQGVPHPPSPGLHYLHAHSNSTTPGGLLAHKRDQKDTTTGSHIWGIYATNNLPISNITHMYIVESLHPQLHVYSGPFRVVTAI